MAWWIRSVSSALLLALLVAPVTVEARKKKPTPEEVQARKLFDEGQKAYDVGEFDHALDLYSQAYKLTPLPGFLFNIAQCHRQKGNYKDAAFFFGRFIDNSSPKASNVELARELMEDMKRRNEQAEADAKAAEEAKAAEAAKKAEAARLAEEAAKAKLTPTETSALPPPPPPPAPEQPLYKKGWFWGVVAGGVAVVGAGVATAVVLRRRPAAVQLPPTSLPDIH